jgi:hypothetical protein
MIGGSTIYADFAQVLIGIARPLYARDPMGVDLNAPSGTAGTQWLRCSTSAFRTRNRGGLAIAPRFSRLFLA